MPWGSDFGVSFVDEPVVNGDFPVFVINGDVRKTFEHFNMFFAKPFRHRVAVGVDGDKAGHVHNPLQRLINRSNMRRQGFKMGLFHDVHRIGVHPAQGTFGFFIGPMITPRSGLGIQILPIGKGSTGKKVVFHISKISFDLGLAISVT